MAKISLRRGSGSPADPPTVDAGAGATAPTAASCVFGAAVKNLGLCTIGPGPPAILSDLVMNSSVVLAYRQASNLGV
jgi:hypothetical protein